MDVSITCSDADTMLDEQEGKMIKFEKNVKKVKL